MLTNAQLICRKKRSKNSEVGMSRKKRVLKREDTDLEQILHPKSYKANCLDEKLAHHEGTAKSQKELRNKNKTEDLVKRLNSTKKGRY